MKVSVKKILTRTALVVGSVFVLVLAAAVAIPYFFKDEIMAKVKEAVNENINATVNFDDVNISILRSFPDFTLSLEGLTVDGIETFQGVRLAAMQEFNIRLDVMSVVRGERFEIESIGLKAPMLYVKILENGMANYDIVKPSTDTTTGEPSAEPAAFELNLDKYSISGGNITFDDESADVFVQLKNLDHEGKGNFTATVYDLATRTTADGFTFNFGGISYLKEAKTEVDLTININMDDAKYTIQENKIKLNALQLALEGFVAMPDNGIDLDLKFGSPQTDFKALLSMIPSAFTKDFSEVKAGGKMAFDGSVKGLFNDSSMPAIDVNLSVDNGSFKYPDLPMGFEKIQIKTNVKSPNQNFDNLVVNFSKFHFDLEGSPFDAQFVLKKPISDPDVDAKVKGRIDLALLSKAFPMAGVTKLDGIINADIVSRMRMSQVLKEDYENIEMRGELTINDLNYVAAGMPAVKIKTLDTDFTPQKVQLNQFEARFGKSDLQAEGVVDNILTYFSGDKTMKGAVRVRSTKFDANEWLQNEASAKTTVQHPDNEPTASDPSTETGVFDKFAFLLDAQFGKIIYDNYVLENNVAEGMFTPQLFDISRFETKIGKSDIKASGTVEDIFAYLFEGKTVKGDLDLQANNFDLNDLMAMSEGGEKTSNSKASSGNGGGGDAPQGEVFGKFQIKTKVQANRVVYDVYELKNLAANGTFRHDVFDVQAFQTQLGNSDLSGSGRINNAINYAFRDNQTVSGDLTLNSNFLDMNQFMTAAPATTTTTTATPASSSSTPSEPILVPSDMAFNIKANVKKLLYDKIEMKTMSGDLVLKDSKVNLNNVRANTLGGSVVLNGAYNTQDKKKPKFEFGYDINSFQVQEAFKTLRSFKYILPIAEYVYGKFNSTLTIEGVLGNDLMPVWTTLNSKGLFETVETVVKGAPVVSKVANQLTVKDLNPFEIKDSKNIFEIKNGKVEIKPFNFNYKDIDFNVSGTHSIAQDMDYTIKLNIPRALFDKNAGTAVVNKGLDFLGQQASKLGINFAQGDYIAVDVLVKGKISDPKTEIKLAGTGGKSTSVGDAVQQKIDEEAERLKKEAEAEIQKKKDELEQKAQQEANKLKAEAEAKAKAEAERLKKEAEARAKAEAERLKKQAEDELKKKVGDKATDVIKNQTDSLKTKVEDKLSEDAKKKLEAEKNKIKNELDKWNPLKKKKGDN